MQCQNCQQKMASIHVFDLEDGQLAATHGLCSKCAESAGFVQPKNPAISLASGNLEDLISSLKEQGGTEPAALPEEEPGEELEACPACGLTAQAFRTRGRLGCPRCYEWFRRSLIPLLERVHDATSHRGRCPGRDASPPGQDRLLEDLQNSLRDAVLAENYELAADLRDRIRRLEQGEDPGA